jgi:LCP family protein required for cell wall assembly
VRARRTALAVVLSIAALVMPDAVARPATVSLLQLPHAKAVDFESGVVWVLAVGSDARPGTDVLKGNADAIQLIGIDFETGAATAIGIPRDSWLDIPDHGRDRINSTLEDGGPKLVAETVAALVGIEPDYVLTAGLTGFEAMVTAIDGVSVNSPIAFEDPEYRLSVKRGRNEFNGQDATLFARSRKLPGDDFARSANQQALLKGILRQLQAHEDEVGFMERGALAAQAALDTDTNLSPAELYRFAQAVTQVRLRRITACVLDGTPGVEFGASIVYVDEPQAKRLGNDARDDARLDGGCR